MTDIELVFGGSFDPPTHAHVLLPQAAASAIGAACIRVLPAAMSPHKMDAPPTAAAHRMEMLELAFADVPDCLIDPRELHREGPSYTIDTLEQLHAEDPRPRRLLMGSDQAEVFHRWHRWSDIEALAEPLVMLRHTDDADTLLHRIADAQGAGARDHWAARLLDLERRPECASQVRAMGDLQQVPEAVARYITQHDLYAVKT